MPPSERIGKRLGVERSHYQPRGGKTVRWDIMINHGDYLGTVAWCGRRGQYTFVPAPQSTFNREFLLDIAAYLALLNKAHREKQHAPSKSD